MSWFNFDFLNANPRDNFYEKLRDGIRQEGYTYVMPNEIPSLAKVISNDKLVQTYNDITREILVSVNEGKDFAEVVFNRQTHDVESFIPLIKQFGYKAEISSVTDTEKTIKISGWNDATEEQEEET